MPNDDGFAEWWEREGHTWRISRIESEMIWGRCVAAQKTRWRAAFVALQTLQQMAEDPLGENDRWAAWRALSDEERSARL